MKCLINDKNSIYVLISSYLFTECNGQINEVVETYAEVQQVTFVRREKVGAF